MSRKHITFPCNEATLTGTIDHGERSTGLLIVSGGNEVRAGAFNGQAKLAMAIAQEGFPCFRFDRRGIGDSNGVNRGFMESADDIAAAIAAFREACPSVKRVVAFGNCDAATALVLFMPESCAALALANPWTLENDQDEWQPVAIRKRYLNKLRNPSEWLRLAKGHISLSGTFKSLIKALKPNAQPSSLVQQVISKLQREERNVDILIAERDRAGQAFLNEWTGTRQTVNICKGASHAFVEPHARLWLRNHLVAILKHKEAGQFDMSGPAELSDRT